MLCGDAALRVTLMDDFGDGWGEAFLAARHLSKPNQTALTDGTIAAREHMESGDYKPDVPLCLPVGCYSLQIEGHIPYPHEARQPPLKGQVTHARGQCDALL